MRFSILYPDPPWMYQNWTETKNGAAAGHYPGVPIDEMCKWQVQDIAAPDSLMFMWATFPHLPDALRLLEAWGFEYVTTPFVWVKTNKKAGTPVFGNGFWTRAAAEIVILGRRGNGLRRLNTRIRQVIAAPAEGHSRKPLIFRRTIVELLGDQPRIELFARHRPDLTEDPHVNGWHATGLEYDDRTLVQAIDYYRGLPDGGASF